MKKSLVGLCVSAVVVSSAMLFINCSGDIAERGNFGSAQLPSFNYFSEPRPEKICGKEGYAFLNRNYINVKCGACHANNGLILPYFAAVEIDIAFPYGSAISREKWLATTTHNEFCGVGCSLDTRGEVYQGLLEWLDSPLSCPN